MVLAAISCRGLIENEKDASREGAEDLRQRLLPWLDRIGAGGEPEPAEARILATPAGELDRRATINATWRSEGLAILAWALHYAALLPFHTICDPVEIAHSMGFFGDRGKTPLMAPRLRSADEIQYWAHTYLTLHWRLRQFSLKPGTMDFVAYASECNWTSMELTDLEIQDNDLAIRGVRIDRVDTATMREVVSITQERRIALDWLLGFEALYSDVTTDT
jgi:hypothetical protein